MGDVVRLEIPGAACSVEVPGDWLVSASAGVQLAVAEPPIGTFASNVCAVLTPDSAPPDITTVLAAIAPLDHAVLLDVVEVGEDGGVDVLLCHATGPFSVTVLQRTMPVEAGSLTLTASAATQRWPAEEGRLREVIDSLEVLA